MPELRFVAVPSHLCSRHQQRRRLDWTCFLGIQLRSSGQTAWLPVSWTIHSLAPFQDVISFRRQHRGTLCTDLFQNWKGCGSQQIEKGHRCSTRWTQISNIEDTRSARQFHSSIHTATPIIPKDWIRRSRWGSDFILIWWGWIHCHDGCSSFIQQLDLKMFKKNSLEVRWWCCHGKGMYLCWCHTIIVQFNFTRRRWRLWLSRRGRGRMKWKLRLKMMKRQK